MLRSDGTVRDRCRSHRAVAAGPLTIPGAGRQVHPAPPRAVARCGRTRAPAGASRILEHAAGAFRFLSSDRRRCQQSGPCRPRADRPRVGAGLRRDARSHGGCGAAGDDDDDAARVAARDAARPRRVVYRLARARRQHDELAGGDRSHSTAEPVPAARRAARDRGWHGDRRPRAGAAGGSHVCLGGSRQRPGTDSPQFAQGTDAGSRRPAANVTPATARR